MKKYTFILDYLYPKEDGVEVVRKQAALKVEGRSERMAFKKAEKGLLDMASLTYKIDRDKIVIHDIDVKEGW